MKRLTPSAVLPARGSKVPVASTGAGLVSGDRWWDTGHRWQCSRRDLEHRSPARREQTLSSLTSSFPLVHRTTLLPPQCHAASPTGFDLGPGRHHQGSCRFRPRGRRGYCHPCGWSGDLCDPCDIGCECFRLVGGLHPPGTCSISMGPSVCVCGVVALVTSILESVGAMR